MSTNQITIFNTLGHASQTLEAINPNHLKIYVCGPTVYNRPHLGNARSIVVYDLWFRLFRVSFDQVTYVRNITDVDDKINKAAKDRQMSIQALTSEIIEAFYDDIDALNNLRPTHEPRATSHIAEVIAMIEKLIGNGFAYVSHGHVLFDVAKYKEYGQLSNRSLDEMIAGARIEVANYKKNPLDFVLWKPALAGDDDSSIFDSPWSKGRPGWHIECSAMSYKYLGANFDIHGGGADLQFPHHENEIAQTCCAIKGAKFASYWIHNGFLTVNGEKMSKSLNNFITVRDLLDEGVDGIVIRYLLLVTHYRKPFDYSQKSLDDAKKTIVKFYSLFDEQDLKNYISKPNHDALLTDLIAALSDDLNVSKAFALLHAWFKEAKASASVDMKNQLLQALDFLGLFDVNFLSKQDAVMLDENYIEEQIQLRFQAKKDKNWALADKIRDDLIVQGVVLEDSKEGTTWKRN